MIRVPIKSYLRKFLQVKLGEERITLQRISDRDIVNAASDEERRQLEHVQKISQIIFGCALFKSRASFFDMQPQQRMNDFIGVEISENMKRKKIIYVDMQAAKVMNNRIDRWFVSELQQYMDGCVSEGGSFLQEGLMDFMNMYNISFEDISFEALKKSYYRNRVALEKKLPPISLGTKFVLDLSLSEKLVG